MEKTFLLVLSLIFSTTCFAQRDDNQQEQSVFKESQLYGTWKLVGLTYIYSTETNKPEEYFPINENHDLYHEYTFEEKFLRMASWVDDYNRRGKKNGKKIWNNHVWNGYWRLNWGSEIQTWGTLGYWISYENMSVYSISSDNLILQLKQILLGHLDDPSLPTYRIWTYAKGTGNIEKGSYRKL